MPQSTKHQAQDTRQENEVLVRVSGVSKKFCRDLKKSLWYGVKDVATELLPASSNKEQGTRNKEPVLRPGEFWANKDISFELRRGECIGLIGHNGAGKTTLLKMLNGLIKPDAGSIEMRGRVGALIALGAGFNPILTGRENIYVNGSILGLTQCEISEKIDDIIDFAEIREFIDSPVQSYSSGMQVRLGFAVASSMEPDILLLDEVLAVGDNAFKVKCLKRVEDLRRTCATIFVSHESFQVAKISSRVLWLDQGKTIKDSTDVNGVLSQYELVGIKRATQTPNKKNTTLSNEFSLRVNGVTVDHGQISNISARNEIKLEIKFTPLEIEESIQSCEIITSILDSGGTPVASVRDTNTGKYHSIASEILRKGVLVTATLPGMPLADGIYHIRISVVVTGTEDFLFYSERAGSICLSDYGHGWYKTILCADWD